MGFLIAAKDLNFGQQLNNLLSARFYIKLDSKKMLQLFNHLYKK